MPTEFCVNMTAEASTDIRGLFDYIHQDSPSNAAKAVKRVLDAVDSLYVLPARHKVVGRSRRTGSRVHSFVVGRFVIYYRVEESAKSVYILTIRHGRRRQPSRFK